MEKEHIAKKQKTDQQGSTNEEKRRKLFITMDAYSRHKLLVNEYMLNHSGATKKLQRNNLNDRTDYDVLRENHKFLWEDDVEPETWEKRLAKKYYDRLFKEYCITDLSYYRQNKIALRWRTEKEVLDGKGQFCCAEKKCSVRDNLKSWEVNFSYSEHGENKNALVKL
ncbi:protein FRA10AC1-like protein, partial [Leptotrombidium deliense]